MGHRKSYNICAIEISRQKKKRKIRKKYLTAMTENLHKLVSNNKPKPRRTQRTNVRKTTRGIPFSHYSKSELKS